MSEVPGLSFLDANDFDRRSHSVGRGAVAVLWCPTGLVLHLRDDIPAISNPGVWSLFGGASDPGETAESTLLRELDEELAISAQIDRLLWRVIDWDGDARLLNVFEASTSVAPAQMVLAEGQAVAAFTLEQALALDLAPLARRVLLAYSSISTRHIPSGQR